MKFNAPIIIVFLKFVMVPALGADTDIVVIPDGDKRAGAIFFVDECLTRSYQLDSAQRPAQMGDQHYPDLPAKGIHFGGHQGYPKEGPVGPCCRSAQTASKSIQTRIPSCRSTAHAEN